MTRREAHSKYHLTDDGHSTIDEIYDHFELLIKDNTKDDTDESLCVELYKQLLVEFKKVKEKNE